MDYQIALFNLMTAFGVISAVVYMFYIAIRKNSDTHVSLLRHSMGITTLIATTLSIFIFINKLLTNENIDNFFELNGILFIVLLAVYFSNTVKYLFFLIFDWDGVIFAKTKNQDGIFAIIAAFLSVCLFFMK